MSEIEAAALVSRFLNATKDYGTREAGRLGGVSHTKVAEWRGWLDGGADPALLPPLNPATVRTLGDYLIIAGEIEVRRMALRLAADRMDELAKRLREEASEPIAVGQKEAEREGREEIGAAGRGSASW